MCAGQNAVHSEKSASDVILFNSLYLWHLILTCEQSEAWGSHLETPAEVMVMQECKWTYRLLQVEPTPI